MIPFEDLKKANRPFEGRIRAALARVAASGRYVLGSEGEAFEREFAASLGEVTGVGVGSGTDALSIAFWALGVREGEVVLPANSCAATAMGILRAGLTPVFSDPDPETFLLDPRDVAGRITPRTVALVPVHLYGLPCDMAPLMDLARSRGLAVVEDCAQAHGVGYRGRPVGTFGDAAAFSFYPTKNLGGLGDGGMVVTPDPAVAERARAIRNGGTRERCIAETAGWTSRLDEVQAAVLRVKFRFLKGIGRRKNRLAARYSALLPSALAWPAQVPGAAPARHLFPVLHPDRDRLRERLRERGIGTEVHYRLPLPRHEALAPFARGEYPAAERWSRETLSLPLSLGNTEREIGEVAAALASLLRAEDRRAV